MKSLFRPFPVPLTPRQSFYLGILQGVGAGLIDGGANFGIAYAMYHGQAEVKMWVFSKNTIAGDLGVTPIVQCLASMLITSTLVHTDLHNRGIAPLPFVYPHVEHLPDPRNLFKSSKSNSELEEKTTSHGSETSVEPPKKGLAYYYLMLIRFIFEGTEKNMMLAKIPVSSWFGRLAWTAAQGAAIGIVFGFPIWCLAIVILGPIYGTGNMGDKWAPQIIKAIYGAIVGWVTNPVIAVLALGSQAEQHLIVVEHDLEEGQEEVAETGEAEGVPTIHEEEEFVSSPTTARRGMLSPADSPSRQLSSLPVPGTPSSVHRARAASNASRISTRPPLVANVSHLSPLPSTSPLPPSPSPALPGRARGDSFGAPAPWASRPRGATVSSFSSNRSYSYHLGGTGGRAQRPRASSRASTSGIPALMLPPSTGDSGKAHRGATAPQRSPRAERTAAWDVFGRTELAPPVSPRVEKTVAPGSSLR